jgi:flavin-dependent dehydrogenase
MTIQKIVILGGGTAGWMTANVLNHELNSFNVSVTLVESASIGTIGVGEGSTPHLKRFFDLLNIDEKQWMPACSATYKNGISFVNWTEHLDKNRYFHPFPSIVDRQTAMAFLQHCMARQQGKNLATNPDDFFIANQLSQTGKGPKAKKGAANIPINYAYHFDSNLVGRYLAKVGKERGITHIEGKFTQAQYAPNTKTISAIKLDSGLIIKGDLFIDASGFISHLLQRSLEVPFISFSDNLLNDSAIAIASSKPEQLNAETKATALENGWAWHIPLTTRTGNGYVFSSRYTTFEAAEAELRAHIASTSNDKSILNTECAPARHIKMRVGQVKEAWKNNVVAVGLAQGFIEPLEATALHLVMETLGLLIQEIKPTITSKSEPNAQAKMRFNQSICDRYNGIRDYIVCHYKVNSRSDTAYWRDNRANEVLSDNLDAVLDAWHQGKDITPVLTERKMTQYYPALSWYCLLAGYGYFSKPQCGPAINQPQFERLRSFIEKTSEQFESHSNLLA